MHATLQLTVIGKVFKANKWKISSLNRNLDWYVECVRWQPSFKSTSREGLHKDAYKWARKRFTLKNALLQTARDKAVEIYKSFKKITGTDSEIHLRTCCIRFVERSFKFSKVDKELTPYWLHLRLSEHYGRVAFPIIFGRRSKLIEKGLEGEYAIESVKMKKRKWE